MFYPRSIFLLLTLLSEVNNAFLISHQPKRTKFLNAVKIVGYEQAFREIDACSKAGKASDKLYDSVRFIDKNARTIYPNIDEKRALWTKAFGSWKLQLATGGGRFTTFKPVPIFAFAVIDKTFFGNGVGLNENLIFLSLLGPHYFNEKIRQMVITIDDMYLAGGNKVTQYVPEFIASGMGLGKKPDEFEKRPPAFTIIGASDSSLIARGGSGGIAIWTRLENDIRPAAYKMNVKRMSHYMMLCCDGLMIDETYWCRYAFPDVFGGNVRSESEWSFNFGFCS